MVYKMLDDLVASKIIAKETRPAEWCLPAFFVPKPDGVKVRLVTKVNKYVKRPVHPFPSVHDIVQSIPAGSKFFAKLDAIHRYFQLALETQSSFCPREDTDIFPLPWACPHLQTNGVDNLIGP